MAMALCVALCVECTQKVYQCGRGKKQTKFLFYSEERNKSESGLFYSETLNGIVKKLVIPKNPLW
jgi:hypothetical protein